MTTSGNMTSLRRKIFLGSLSASALLAALMNTSAHGAAATLYWAGTTGQDWNSSGAAGKPFKTTLAGTTGSTFSSGDNAVFSNTSGSFLTSLTLGGTATTAGFVYALNQNVTVTDTATLTSGNFGAESGSTLTLSVPIGGTTVDINGAGITGVTGSTSKTGTVVFSSANTYTGATTVSAGTLAVTVNNALGTTAGGTTVSSGATLDFRTVTYSTTEAVTLNGGTLASSTGTSSFAGAVTLGTGGGTANIANALTLSGAVTGTTALTKTGSGTLTLTNGSNSYSGGTTINLGTLKVDGSLTSAANSVAINSGGTLAGSGTIAGATTLNSGGFISPANGSIGTLSLASLTFNGGGTLNLGLGSGTSSDTVAITGAFTQGTAGTYTIDFGNTGTAGNTYTLATFGSTTFASGASFTFANLAPGVGGSFALSGTDLTFTTTAIPEPSTYAAILGLGALGFVIYRRRQARATVAVTTEV